MSNKLISRTDPVLLPLYPRLVRDALGALGYDEDSLFRDLPFSSAELQNDRFRLSIDQHELFILRAIEVSGDPHLPLRINREQGAAVTNMTILAIANSGQIARALHAITRYFKTITRVFSIVSVETDGDAVMDLEIHLQNDQVSYFALCSFGLFLNDFFADPLQGQSLVRRLRLPFPEPEDFPKVRDQFPFAMDFDAPVAQVCFHGQLLDEPMPRADEQTMRLLTEVCERQLQEAEAEISFTGRLRWFLINRVSSPPSVNDAARTLGVSPRSLRRRLAEAGTSFQTLLDEVRCRTATRLLQESAAPVSTIAYELGFNSPSDFSRAFRKWTGQSPSDWRKHTL